MSESFSYSPKEQERLPQYQTEDREIPSWIVNEAHLINEALEKDVVTRTEATEGLVENKEILDMMRGLVEVKYFVEYPPENVDPADRGEKMLELFKSPVLAPDGTERALAEHMAEKRQAVSIAMITLDEKTAETIRYLNETGVPVIGWVVLEDEKGYWTNQTSMKETVQRTKEIRQWAKENELDLVALGFDAEKPLDFISALSQMNIKEIFKALRTYRKARKEAAKTADPQRVFDEMISTLRDEGVSTEAYTFPKGFKGIMGDLSVATPDKRVEMLYSSTMPFWNKRLMHTIWSEGAVPALGLASGKEDETPGRDLSGKGEMPKHLSKEDLTAEIENILDREMDFGERRLTLREIYLFALNDARVALMMDAALEDAFQAKAG